MSRVTWGRVTDVSETMVDPRMTARWKRHRPAVAAVFLAFVFIASAVVLGPLPPAAKQFHPVTFAGPTLVTSVGTACASKSTVTTGTMGTIASGDAIAVFVEIAQGTAITVTGVTSSIGTNKFVKEGTSTNAGNARAEVWVASFTTGGAAYKAIVNTSGSTFFCVQAVAFSGTDLFNSVDVVGAGTTGSNATSTNTLTQNYVNEYVLMATAIKTTSTSQTVTAIGSWAVAQSNMATSGMGGAIVDQNVATTGTHIPAMTISTSLQWAAIGIAINNTGAPHTAPTGVTATALSASSETITYTKAANQPGGTVTNYTVLTGAAGGACGTQAWATWTTYTTSGGTGVSVTVSGLSGATNYCYSVIEWNATGRSPAAANTTAFTEPAVESAFSCGSPTVTTIACSWTNPSGTLVNNSIFAYASASCTGNVVNAVPSLGVVTSTTITGLSGATQYSFRGNAWSSGGRSAFSSCVSVTTKAGVPTGLTIASTTATTVGLTWTNPGGTIVNDTTYQWTGASCSGTVTATSLGTSGTSNTQTGLASASEFAFEAQAWSSSGQSGVSNCAQGYTLPTAPTGLTIGVVTVSTIALTWSNPGGTLVNDTVYQWTGSSCSGTVTSTSLGTAGTSSTQTGLASATTFAFQVGAWSSGGQSALTACQTGTTLPTNATMLVVSSVAATTISLAWSNPSGTIVNDTVYRWAGSSCSGTVTATSLGTSGTSNTQTGLAGASAFSFEVQAWSSGGGSTVSNCATGTTVPTAATGLTVGVVSTSVIDLTWANPSGTLANDTLYGWSAGSCSGGFSFSAGLGVATSANPGGLNPASAYSFEIGVWSAGGQGALSSCATGTTLPGPPTGLGFLSITTTSLTASWTNPSGTLVNDTVFRWTGISCSGTVTATSLGAPGTSSTQSGLNPATAYSVEVAAWSAGGSSVTTSCATEATLPNAPTGLSATVITSTSVTLTWTNPSGTLVNDTVYRWTGASCSGTVTATSLGTSGITNVQSGLASDTQFSFGVAAWSIGGTSALSTCVHATTLPGSPTGLTPGAITTTTIALAWTNPGGVLTNSTVYRWTSGACSGTVHATSLGSAMTSDTQSGLVEATTYSFAVSAWGSGGTSGLSNCVTTSTLATSVTFLTLVLATPYTLLVNWTNPAGALVNNTAYISLGSCGLLVGNSTGVVLNHTFSGLLTSTVYCLAISVWTLGGESTATFLNATTLSGGGGFSAGTYSGIAIAGIVVTVGALIGLGGVAVTRENKTAAMRSRRGKSV